MISSVHRGVLLSNERPESLITIQDLVDAINRSTSLEYARFEKGKLLSHNAPILQLAITANHTQSSGIYSVLFTEDSMVTNYTDKIPFNDHVALKKTPNLNLSKIDHIERFQTVYKYKHTLSYDRNGELEGQRLDIDIIKLSIFLNGIRRKNDCQLAKIKANAMYLEN